MSDQNSASAVDIISEYTSDDSSTGNLVLKTSYDDDVYVADVYILKGKIYSCTIDKTEPPIGMRLYTSGLIPQEEFSDILKSSGHDQNSPAFFQELLDHNVVSEKIINSYIRDEFLAAMRIILTWTHIEDFEWRSLEQTNAFRVPPLSLEQVYEKVSSNYEAIGGIMDTIYAHAEGVLDDDDEEEADAELDAENLVPIQLSEPEEGDLSVERYNIWKKITGKQTLSQIMSNYGQVITPLLKSIYVLWEKGYISLRLYGIEVDSYSSTRREENERKEKNEINEKNLQQDEIPTPQSSPSEEIVSDRKDPINSDTDIISEDDYDFEEQTVESPDEPHFPLDNHHLDETKIESAVDKSSNENEVVEEEDFVLDNVVDDKEQDNIDSPLSVSTEPKPEETTDEDSIADILASTGNKTEETSSKEDIEDKVEQNPSDEILTLLDNSSIMSISINDMPEKSNEFLSKAKELEESFVKKEHELNVFKEEFNSLNDEKSRLKDLIAQVDKNLQELDEKQSSTEKQLEQDKVNAQILKGNGEKIKKVYEKILSSLD